MKYPEFLKDKGTIGVCSPSLGATYNPYLIRVKQAKKNMEKQGHEVIFTKSVFKNKKCRSTSGENRVKELMSLYDNEKVNLIISQGGGEVMFEILKYLDFKHLKEAKPKWFMGFSDNTILTFTLPTICDIASIYGNCFTEFGITPWNEFIKNDYEFVKGNKNKLDSLDKYEIESYKKIPGRELETYNLTEKVKWKCLTKEKSFTVEGRSIGGCLEVLAMLCGTEYDNVSNFVEKYKDDGIIWFIESCGINVMNQITSLWQLKSNGWFKYAKAIIIGRPGNTETMFDTDYKEANLQELKELNIPVVIDADFGHVPPRLPIIMGAYYKVNYNKGKANIEYELK